MKEQIIKILKQHPYGLRAREIATYIAGADRRAVNQVLYSNLSVFEVSDYNWTIKKEAKKRITSAKIFAPKTTATPIPRKSVNPSYNTSSLLVSYLDSFDNYKSSYITSGSYSYKKTPAYVPQPDLVVARKCIGNCSTCNRERCVEEC